MAEWDRHHRENILGNNAVQASPYAKEITDCIREMDVLFGNGQGRALYRNVHIALNQRFSSVKRSPCARAFSHLADIVGGTTASYTRLSISLHARTEWTRQRRGSHTQESLLRVNSRRSTVDFATFLPIFSDALQTLRPLTMAVSCSNRS
jgi:hypothetical protein